MAMDKYTALWVSHTSISDFLKCPRSYYLKHIYRDPETRHKIKLITPPLALGQAVHEVIESLSNIPFDSRFKEPLIVKFDKVWEKVSGKRGGFWDNSAEYKYKELGKEMLRNLTDNPGLINHLSVKIQKDLPYFWISPDDNIILCGKIDWLEYLPDTDSVHIVDFKTSKNEEDPDSLQLPIYYLLVKNCQKRNVTKASYWYLAKNQIEEKKLPEETESLNKILTIAKQIKLAKQLNRFKCPNGDGCVFCKSMEKIVNKEAELVGVDEYNYDVYILNNSQNKEDKDSVIL